MSDNPRMFRFRKKNALVSGHQLRTKLWDDEYDACKEELLMNGVKQTVEIADRSKYDI